MTRPKPLFIMGNKRSGSTLMTDLLNSHTNVFVSHESDIAWREDGDSQVRRRVLGAGFGF
jgi:LPS sulfotransferase NodH